MWWKLAVVRSMKRKKKSTKIIQASAKKKISKESGKRSTLESLPSL